MKSNLSSEKYKVLQETFGYSSFRKGQEEIIDSILQHFDTLAILPTGGGKSICYQVPALLFPGLTVIISPLISLMNDQVDTLLKKHVRAAALNSTLPTPQRQAILQQLVQGQLRLLYLSPEQLTSPHFMRFCAQNELHISMLCVDEAHCISQWGREFRPAYRRISSFIEALPKRPAIAAFTATAAPKVRQDIISFLKMQEPRVFTMGFDRTNLYYEVRHPKDKWQELLRILPTYQNQCGIIYALTRTTVDHLSHRLNAFGIPALKYHGGMSKDERDKNQSLWIDGKIHLIVATNAFGMGIDKPDVRYVIHYNMPQDLEGYYQEAGRAGRDGLHSDCILLASYQDIVINRHFISHVSSEEEKKIENQKLAAMIGYAEAKQCLRQFVLQYFGDEAPDFCGHCSVCLHTAKEEPIDEALRQRHILIELRSLRKRLADQRHCDAASILPDQYLRALAIRRPHSMVDLLLMEGISPLFCIKYGADFLSKIRALDHSVLI